MIVFFNGVLSNFDFPDLTPISDSDRLYMKGNYSVEEDNTHVNSRWKGGIEKAQHLILHFKQ